MKRKEGGLIIQMVKKEKREEKKEARMGEGRMLKCKSDMICLYTNPCIKRTSHT